MSSAGVSAPKRGRPRDDIEFVRIQLKRDVTISGIPGKNQLDSPTRLTVILQGTYFSIFVRMRLNLHIFHEQISNPLTTVNTKLFLVIIRITYSIKICIY